MPGVPCAEGSVSAQEGEGDSRGKCSARGGGGRFSAQTCPLNAFLKASLSLNPFLQHPQSISQRESREVMGGGVGGAVGRVDGDRAQHHPPALVFMFTPLPRAERCSKEGLVVTKVC